MASTYNASVNILLRTNGQKRYIPDLSTYIMSSGFMSKLSSKVTLTVKLSQHFVDLVYMQSQEWNSHLTQFTNGQWITNEVVNQYIAILLLSTSACICYAIWRAKLSNQICAKHEIISVPMHGLSTQIRQQWKCDDGTDLNEVGKHGAAQFLLQDLTVPVHQIAAWNERWKQNVGETGITEICEWQWAELLQDGRRLSRLNDHLRTSTCTHNTCMHLHTKTCMHTTPAQHTCTQGHAHTTPVCTCIQAFAHMQHLQCTEARACT